MKKTTRRKYTDEFKDNAVKLVTEHGYNTLSMHPDIKTLFMSGYTESAIEQHGVLNSGVHFIQKPFTMNDLAKKIHAVVQP